ncbi:ATP-dependent endonuclease [Chromobacterium piscinae]|uniref:ATP-dependent nuclease n=1 Tax=Chromobacterium piscinae TaxID=686831 RepID=UPI001E2E91BA|nr:AAA family ATPase [Chromobacterium piscinae]MCD5327523.1 AAA family ATPase [Chromobacterium piscinae]
MFVKLEKLIIKNFRSIGSNPIEVSLDDIVVLVGENNAGKSTILRAYEAAVGGEQLSIDDYPGMEPDASNLPEVEIHTLVDQEAAPDLASWCEKINDDPLLYRVKERWTWPFKAGSKPVRLGFRVDLAEWADDSSKPKQPWATDNVAMARRPKVHRIGTFDNPQEQSDAIKSLVMDILLEEKIKSYIPKDGEAGISGLTERFTAIKKEFIEASKEGLSDIAENINKYVSKVIAGHQLTLGVGDAEKEIGLKIFDAEDLEISFGTPNELYPIENHGSGARRTLMWAVLKALADMGYSASGKVKGKKYETIQNRSGHVLLLDEPEISLHPQAVRDACDVLYSLPSGSDWQVMITTHSPSFIDLSKDHTKIIRVEKIGASVASTTLFSADEVKLSADERENMKLLNLIDPHVLEFFFGGRVILVEGDTEYTAFNELIQKMDELKDILVVRARGKVQVASLMKVLNHFKKQYVVLHDTDTPKAKKTKKTKLPDGNYKIEEQEIVNPAWTNNWKILDAMSAHSKVFASIHNFESAYFGEIIDSGKPENAMEMMKDPDKHEIIKKLLLGLLGLGELPEGVINWTSRAELEGLF